MKQDAAEQCFKLCAGALFICFVRIWRWAIAIERALNTVFMKQNIAGWKAPAMTTR
ncbi:hypothetical protein CEV34_1404 [Brucella pseudogrignonensis]|uniref:Uncharacterized protein n=1 Tax=Brucella pseudogrignonensis TaxID=419475 RepID=A0A256GM73_9HYPH|nr:hypothetical protein CEV34_1404 [Brucella pseudogrignonensis]